ncbi:MAG: ion transporter [Hyphomonadaceae bacterium]|nr:ion transporter [Hyphomonadaceae bacterium]
MTPEQPHNFAGETAGAAAPNDAPRARVGRFVHSEGFRNAILAVIVVNAILLGINTDHGFHDRYGRLMAQFDLAVTAIFVCEISMKLYADRLKFFRDGWNVFDFLIVFASVLTLGSTGVAALRVFRVLRVVRVLRVFRLFSVVKELRRVVEAFLNAIPGMSAIIAVLLLMFYVSAVITTDLFGREQPELFGSMGASFFTLFQIMTGDGWSEVVRLLDDNFPWAWLFFVPFITLTSFAVLNMFIAVIVDSLQREQVRAIETANADLRAGITEARETLEGEIGDVSADVQEIEDAEVVAARERAEIMASIAALREELREMRAGMAKRE